MDLRRATVALPPAALLRRLLVFVLLAAVTTQAYLVQTHIHVQPARVHVQPVPALGSLHGTPPGRPDTPLDPATCQICMEILHAGVAITPVQAPLAVALTWVVMAVIATPAARPTVPPATGWQSRAPPRG